MEVHIKPEIESRLKELASKSGRTAGEVVESGRVKPIDGRAFFQNVRQREAKLLNQRSTK
jgi:hypothetical protein